MRGSSGAALASPERRLRHNRAAREALDEPRASFEQIRARLWAERAHEETERIGGRRAEGDELTAAERRVAELVGQGLSNREVASTLFLSGKTVEFTWA